LYDDTWTVSGTIVPEADFGAPLNLLKVKLQVRSGKNYETPAELSINEAGEFSFSGRRLCINPGKTFELLLVVCDQIGKELTRHYSLAQPGQENAVRIRVGAPFLDVWQEFRATHPQLAERLERFDHDPKQAHATAGDTWLGLRRWAKLNTWQVAEGVVRHAKHGPIGDPDWTWDIWLDPLYDSDDGFRLPNENNRLRHGGLHVEACQSLSREALADGLTADADSVPKDTRVWMLGTHVYDDAWDFGSPDHEHNELHPLYVIEPCMGGWFHFAVSESIALAGEAAKDDLAPARDDWPWKETTPGPYREAYLKRLRNPHRCREEMAFSYNLIYERFRRTNDNDGLADFFAHTSLRYARLGVDLGRPMDLSPDPYRAWALEMIEKDRAGTIRNTLVDYLARLFRFLHGPASSAGSPVRGPAPQSFLRCVYAVEMLWAAEASASAIGEPNPRISLNRATARRVDDVRQQLGVVYSALFNLTSDPARRGELFAEAVLRYQSWAVQTDRETENMNTDELRAFGSGEVVETLAEEMRARVDAFWNALTPHRRT
jgi:hypothetical protein